MHVQFLPACMTTAAQDGFALLALTTLKGGLWSGDASLSTISLKGSLQKKLSHLCFSTANLGEINLIQV